MNEWYTDALVKMKEAKVIAAEEGIPWFNRHTALGEHYAVSRSFGKTMEDEKIERFMNTYRGFRAGQEDSRKERIDAAVRRYLNQIFPGAVSSITPSINY